MRNAIGSLPVQVGDTLPRYRCFSEQERIYPEIVIPGTGSLVAKAGDEVEMDEPPDWHWWIEVPEPSGDKPADQGEPEPEPSFESDPAED